MTESRFMGAAAGGSLVLHLAAYLIAVLLVVAKGLPEWDSGIPGTPESGSPMDERTMITPDMIIVEEVGREKDDPENAPKHDSYVDATGMREVEAADPKARLEADRNTAASSDTDTNPIPNPDAPAGLPWQQGENIASVHIVVAAASASPIHGDGDVILPDSADSGSEEGAGTEEALRNAMKGAAPGGEEVSVAAVETPRARYQTAVNKALTESKNRVVARTRLPEGSAKVAFNVDRQGRKTDARFVEPPSDARIGDAALNAVLEANLPSIPDELFEELPDGKLPFTIDFISYK